MRRGRLPFISLLAAAGFFSQAADAASPFPLRAERLFSPGRSAASEDSAEAVVLNPANLANLPSWEARTTHLRCPDDAQKVGCGWAFELAAPLPLDFGAAVRVDLMQPPWGGLGQGVGFPYRGYDYTWVTWALGYSLGERASFGLSVQRAYSENATIDGLLGVTAGFTYRPYNQFAFAAVAHDFNRSSGTGGTGTLVLDRSFALAMAFRPTGRRNVELGLDMRYLTGTEDWMPRLSAQVDIPGVGRARGDVEVAHLPNDERRGVVATAGLELSFDHVNVGGGVAVGSGLGKSSTVGEFGSISITGQRNPGIPRPQRAVSLRLESTPGTRGHVALLRKLWRIAEDREIAAVTLVPRAEIASSYAHAEELADAFRVLRAHGKKVVCSMEDNGAKTLYVCANADRVVVNPAGGVRYAGLRTQYTYLAPLMAKLGIKGEFVRIGAHKTAPEQFTNEWASEVARGDHIDLLRNAEAVFNKNLAQGRHMTEDQAREVANKGPFVASEARELRLVDGFAFDDELERVTQDVVGRSISYGKYEDEPLAPEAFGAAAKVGILYVDGDIVDGRSQTVPLLDMKLVGSYTIVEEIKRLKDDATVRSVVLRIESPGGSSMASDVMWRELTQLAQKKPLIVSMGSVAASGGYYIAVAGKPIFALPLTITGSIGVFYGKADISEMMKKIGINVETYKTAPRADAESLYRGFTPEERVELQRKVGQFYDTFLDRVSTGRGMPKSQIDAVGQGRVWMGQQAIQHKLVDRLGGLREALEAAREAGNLPHDAPIVEYPPVEKSLLQRVLKLVGFDTARMPVSIEALPAGVRDLARALAPMAVHEPDVALARLPFVSLDRDDTPGKD